jgi:hypothetical protein
VSDLIYKDLLISDLKTRERSFEENHPDWISIRLPLLAVIEYIESGKYDAPSPRCSVCGREIPPADAPRMCVGCAEGEGGDDAA